MRYFKCKLLDKSGEIAEVYRFSKSPEVLASEFERSNLTFISAKIQKSDIKSPIKDFTIPFLKNLHQLTRNNFNLVSSLEIVSKTFRSKEASAIVDHIIYSLKRGLSFSCSLSGFTRYFDDFVIKTIEISEKTAKVPEVLSKIIKHLESSIELSRKIRNALRYPMILLGCVCFVFLFWLIAIVPRFVDLFSEMNVSIPICTRIIMKMSNFLIEHWLFVFLAGTAIIGLILKYINFSDILRKIPIINSLQRKLRVLNFCNAMSIMMQEKINILDCLKSLGNSDLEIEPVMELLRNGNSFSRSITEANLFDPYELSIIETAESSGDLESAFCSISLLSQTKIEHTLKGVLAIIPTIIICFIGLLLILIVYSLVIPLYSSIDLYV